MGGDADQLIGFGGGLFGDHLLDSVASGVVGCGEQDAGWHIVGSDTATSEKVKVAAAFTFDTRKGFGGEIYFKPPGILMC